MKHWNKKCLESREINVTKNNIKFSHHFLFDSSLSVDSILGLSLGAGDPQMNEMNVAPVIMEGMIRCGWGTDSKWKYTLENL